MKYMKKRFQKFHNKKFPSIKKYEELTKKCHNCHNGKVGKQRKSNCFYCNGSAIQSKKYLPKELYDLVATV